MSEVIRRLKDEAAELARKGKTEKALKLYQKVLEEAPKDVAALSAAGNLLRRLGRSEEAVDIFNRLVECYVEGGFFLRAIAACKLILEISPQHAGAHQKLAELCQQQTAGRTSPTCQQEEPSPQEPPSPGEPMPSPEVRPEPEVDIEIDLDEEAPQQETFEVETSTPASVLAEASGEKVESTAEASPPPPAALGVAETTVAEPAPAGLDKMRIPLLADLPSEAFMGLVERMKMVRLRAGDWVVREGAQGDSMFLVVSGQVRVLKQREKGRMWQLAVLGDGTFFGEMALLQGGLRAASVQAVKPTVLFEITRELMEEIAARYSGVKEVLEKFMVQRLLRNVMNTSPLFEPFSPAERVQLIERFVLREVEPGEVVVRQGVEGQGLFVVLHGSLQVSYSMEDGREIDVGELREGEVFGEISCLKKTGCTATVKAVRKGAVLRLPREDFEELVCSHPQVLELVDRLGEERLAKTLNTLAAQGVLL